MRAKELSPCELRNCCLGKAISAGLKISLTCHTTGLDDVGGWQSLKELTSLGMQSTTEP
jgi:hypothetical protein